MLIYIVFLIRIFAENMLLKKSFFTVYAGSVFELSLRYYSKKRM